MGFEILPIEEGEIDEIDHKLDIFEITSDAPWNPTKFRACMGTIEVASGMGGTLPMDGMSQDGVFQDSGGDFMTLLENDGLRNAKISFSADFMDTFLDNLSTEELTGQVPSKVDTEIYPSENEVMDSYDTQALLSQLQFGDTRISKTFRTIRPWHRVIYPQVDPAKLRPFLA